MNYRTTQIEVTPGYKKPDGRIDKKLTALQLEALNVIIELVDGGSTINIYNEDNKKVAGVSQHNVRVSTERWQRWPSKDGKVDVSKSTLKPLIEAGLLTAHNSRYTPDLVLTEAGRVAAASGSYGKPVNGEWVMPVMRPMTADEQAASDLDWYAETAEKERTRCVETAEQIAKRLEDVAKEIRRSAEGCTIERAKAYGADELYFSNGVISRVHQTVSNMRFDILTSAEARMVIALNRLTDAEGENEDDD